MSAQLESLDFQPAQAPVFVEIDLRALAPRHRPRATAKVRVVSATVVDFSTASNPEWSHLREGESRQLQVEFGCGGKGCGCCVGMISAVIFRPGDRSLSDIMPPGCSDRDWLSTFMVDDNRVHEFARAQWKLDADSPAPLILARIVGIYLEPRAKSASLLRYMVDTTRRLLASLHDDQPVQTTIEACVSTYQGEMYYPAPEEVLWFENLFGNFRAIPALQVDHNFLGPEAAPRRCPTSDLVFLLPPYKSSQIKANY